MVMSLMRLPEYNVVFQEKINFAIYEFGVITTSGYPYCAWEKPDGKIAIVPQFRSLDDLLTYMVAANPTAAKWLFFKGFALESPKETVIAMAKAGLFFGISTDDETTLKLRRRSILSDDTIYELRILNLYHWVVFDDENQDFQCYNFHG